MSRNYYSLPDAEEDLHLKLNLGDFFYNEGKI